jgi:voltage-gated sodium channel
MENKVRTLIESRRFETVIMLLIIINAITLGLETSSRAMEAAGSFLVAADKVILGIFTIEVLTRMLVYRLSFGTPGVYSISLLWALR